jgi:hypothetical protein
VNEKRKDTAKGNPKSHFQQASEIIPIRALECRADEK